MPPDLKIYGYLEPIDLDWTFHALKESYWGYHYTREQVMNAIDRSVCVSAFIGKHQQIGFARAITDRATVSMIHDVIVDEKWRGQGVGTAMMDKLLNHSFISKTICVLQTRNAHGLYLKFGFVPIGNTFKRDPR